MELNIGNVLYFVVVLPLAAGAMWQCWRVLR